MTEPPFATVSELAATTAWSLLVVTVFLLVIINIAARGERGEHAGAAPDAVWVWRLHAELAEPDHAKPANSTTRQRRQRSTHGRGASGRGTSGYGAPGRASAGHGRTGPAVDAAQAERTDTPRNRAASIAAASARASASASANANARARASASASAADRHARAVPTSTPAQPAVDDTHRAACARYLAERRDRILAAEPPAYLGRHRLREPDNPSIDELTTHLPGIPLTVALSATHG